MTQPRIAILGSGANGASVGADLTRAGQDVTLIEQWPEHVEAMRSNGIRINMLEETRVTEVRVLHLCEVATLRHQFDIVLVMMKAYDTRWACQLIEPYLDECGLVAGVQNGMTANVVAEVVGPQRTIGTVIEITSSMSIPGIVDRHSPPSRSWFAVGSLDPSSAGREQEIAKILENSGQVEVVEDIIAAKWMKLVSNATTLVTSAIVGLSIAEAAAIPEMRALMVLAGKEALAAGQKIGLQPLPIFGLSSRDLQTGDGVVEQLLDTLLSGFVLPKSRSTVAQDWCKGRRSEVDDINGQVIRMLGSRSGLAPVNSAIVHLAHSIERGELSPSVELMPRLRELVSQPVGVGQLWLHPRG